MAVAVQLDDLLGTPWVDGGRDPATGLDCLGLVLEVGRRQGFRVADPGRDLLRGRGSLGAADDIFARDAIVGDVLLFRLRDGDHVAVVTEPGWVMQCSAPYGVVRVRLDLVLSLTRRAYRWRERV